MLVVVIEACAECGVECGVGVCIYHMRGVLPAFFMFPILCNDHYFFLCFDFCNGWYEIINNSIVPVNKQLKYGEYLEDMKNMLSEFFKTIDLAKFIICAGINAKRMQMPWRDSKNKVDYGVYIMCHMETYVCQGVSKWDCGLTKGDTAKLRQLMLHYMKEITTSEFNLHRLRNLSRAFQFISPPLCGL
nr:uncharacterized protein LOC109154777 isoform X2 [Ipomoea trifida]